MRQSVCNLHVNRGTSGIGCRRRVSQLTEVLGIDYPARRLLVSLTVIPGGKTNNYAKRLMHRNISNMKNQPAPIRKNQLRNNPSMCAENSQPNQIFGALSDEVWFVAKH